MKKILLFIFSILLYNCKFQKQEIAEKLENIDSIQISGHNFDTTIIDKRDFEIFTSLISGEDKEFKDSSIYYGKLRFFKNNTQIFTADLFGNHVQYSLNSKIYKSRYMYQGHRFLCEIGFYFPDSLKQK